MKEILFELIKEKKLELLKMQSELDILWGIYNYIREREESDADQKEEMVKFKQGFAYKKKQKGSVTICNRLKELSKE